MLILVVHGNSQKWGGGHSLERYKPVGTGDREKGSHTFIGPERGNRSDRALLLTLGPLSANSCLCTLVGIPSYPQKSADLCLLV